MQELATDVGAEHPQSRVEIRYRLFDEIARQPPDEPLRRDARDLVRALLGAPSADDLVVTVELFDQLRDAVVRIREIGIGPRDDPTSCRSRPDAPRRPRA